MIRPLEKVARKMGVRFLLHHKMSKIERESKPPSRVTGIIAEYAPRFLPGQIEPLRSFNSQGNIDSTSPEIRIGAKIGVIIATGGHSSNLNFRRIFDPRLTEEYQVVGEPYSFQDASGEIAAMRVGASLWGTANQTIEIGVNLVKPSVIGCRYGYPLNPKFSNALGLLPRSPIFPLIRATGLIVRDYQDIILVNQAGVRFWNEMEGNYPYPPSAVGGSFLAAALDLNPSSLSGSPDYGGGPIWAIFDSQAARREDWNLAPPNVDPDGYFFSGNTIEELALRIKCPFQRTLMDPKALRATVAKYNSFVDGELDPEFGKPSPKYKLDAPPFYAAFATPMVHDSRCGLRINARCQVIDMAGEVIPGLYCCGESAGGTSQHGLGRCIVQGRIAGMNCASSSPSESVP